MGDQHIKGEEIADRRRSMEWLVEGYQRDIGNDDDLSAVQDMLSDLLHVARSKGMNDVDHFTQTAILNFEAEEQEAGYN